MGRWERRRGAEARMGRGVSWLPGPLAGSPFGLSSWGGGRAASCRNRQFYELRADDRAENLLFPRPGEHQTLQRDLQGAARLGAGGATKHKRAKNVVFFFPPQLHPDPLLKLQFADVGEKSLPSRRSLLWPSVGALAVHCSHFPSCPLAPALARAGCAWCCVAAEHHCWLPALWAGPQARETRLSYASSPLPGRHSPVSHLLIILSSHRCGFRTAAGPAAWSCQQQLPRAPGGLNPTLLPAPAFCPRSRQHG